MYNKGNSPKPADRVREERERMTAPPEILVLRKRKRAVGVSQEELAQITELSVGLLQKIEQGHRSLTQKTAHTLAVAFGVRAEFLLGEDDFRTEEQYSKWKSYTELSEKSRTIQESMEPGYHLIIQDLLEQGAREGDYSFSAEYAPNDNSLVFVVFDGLGNSIVLDKSGYLDDLRDEAIDFLKFKLNRHIQRSLSAKRLEYIAKETGKKIVSTGKNSWLIE